VPSWRSAIETKERRLGRELSTLKVLIEDLIVGGDVDGAVERFKFIGGNCVRRWYTFGIEEIEVGAVLI
jgi:hypothetical protein